MIDSMKRHLMWLWLFGLCGLLSGQLKVRHVPDVFPVTFLPGVYRADYEVTNAGTEERTVTLRLAVWNSHAIYVSRPQDRAAGEVRDILLKPGERRVVGVSVPLSGDEWGFRECWRKNTWGPGGRRRAFEASLWEGTRKLWSESASKGPGSLGLDVATRCHRWVSPLFSERVGEQASALVTAETKDKEEKSAIRELTQCVVRASVDRWPVLAREYAGFSGIWLTEEEWEAAGEKVREALWSYVHGGGTLVRWQLEGKPGKVWDDQPFGLGRMACLRGVIPMREALSEAGYVLSKKRQGVGKARTEDSLFGRRLDWSPAALAKARLGRCGMSKLASGLLLLAVVLVLGPGVYIYLRLRKRCIWCLAVTPVASLVVSAVLFLGMLGMEGCGYRSRVDSVVAWDGETGRLSSHSLVNAFGIRAPEALTLGNGDRLEMLTETPGWGIRVDGEEQVRYGGEFLRDYASMQVVVRRWGRRTEGLVCRHREDGALMLHNGFGVALKDVAVLGRDGRCYYGREVGPGQTMELEPAKVSRHQREPGKLVSWAMLSDAVGETFEERDALAMLLEVSDGTLGSFAARSAESMVGDVGLEADVREFRTVIVGRMAAEEVSK